VRSATQRTLALLRERGYLPYVVETWNAYARVRKDLFGFIDIVALHPKEPGVLAVQSTVGSHLAERVKKAEALPAYHLWISQGNPVEFIAWRKIKSDAKPKRKVWRPIVRRIAFADLL